jgi:tRNA A-37 threonylcarbamoyl transferase component Bud32
VWTVTSAIFLVNLVAAYGIGVPFARLLSRDDPGNLFWDVFAMGAIPALAAIFVRAHRAPPGERQKAVRLGCALAAGAAPLLLMGLARLMLPDVNRWMLSATGGLRGSVDAVTIAALAAMPLMATLAVIHDRPFDLQVMAPSRLRPWLAGSGIRVAEILHTGSLRPVRRRAWLTAALDQVRSASGVDDVGAIVCRELQVGVGAVSVRIHAREDLPAGSALTAMLEESPAPLSLSRDAEPFVLLPAGDREWLEGGDVVLAAPIRRRDGTLAAAALLGERRGGGSYDRTDRWFIATLLTGAAAAWEIQDIRFGDADVAYECDACGRVSAAPGCGECGGASRAALLPRRLAGKFEIVRRHGAGGMGVVYLARDTALARDVALKTLPIRETEGIARLRGEARAMATLNHDGLATIYGLEFWRQTPVLVVEYFAGGTLADVLARGALPRDEVVALGIRLADALAYMHDRGFLHRDVKPSNIGFTADGVAKLLDFGLSDAGGTAAGTPGYLPPEALSGAPPDAAVDLWGLAVVLLQAVGDHDPDLAAFFARALAPSPADRFESARDLAAALHRLRRQTGATPGSAPPHLRH